MEELKDMMRGDEEVEGRDENYYDVNQQVSQPITTVMKDSSLYSDDKLEEVWRSKG